MKTQGPIKVDTGELCHRLINAGYSPDEAASAMNLENAYAFCAGLLQGVEWNQVFATKEDYESFKAAYCPCGLETFRGKPIYVPYQFERVLVGELGMTNEVAKIYTEINDQYLAELGVM